MKRKKKNDLVRVKVAPMVYVKIPRREAILLGYIPDPNAAPVEVAKPKRRTTAKNKQRTIAQDKSTEVESGTD